MGAAWLIVVLKTIALRTGCEVFLGSWISSFFSIVTDARMQRPVAYDRLPWRGEVLKSF
jgi:cytochrome bd-type quinol oxidase subunit 1